MINKIKLINNLEKEKIIRKLNEQFGITKIKGTLIKIGEENIFLFTGNIQESEIKKLDKIIKTEKIGIYFGKIKEDKIIPGIEAIQILKDQLTKNIFDLNEEQVKSLMQGKELEIKSEKTGYIAIRYKEDFIGLGKASEEKITSLIPKSRRLKN